MSKRYFKPEGEGKPKGVTHYCDHPLYNDCTLFMLPNGKGLAVIQQRFNPQLKYTWWTKIDETLNIDISASPELKSYLEENAQLPSEDFDLYPTVEVRKVMWALKLPPLRKHAWETRF